jgi:hypothetical protein
VSGLPSSERAVGPARNPTVWEDHWKEDVTMKATTSTSASPSPASAPAGGSRAPLADYRGLLIQADDLAVASSTYAQAQPPTLNPIGKPGIEGVFQNLAGNRKIIDTILLAPDSSVAQQALQSSLQQLSSKVAGAASHPAATGSGATMVSGTTPDGTTAVTVLLFTEGRAFVTMEFDSAPDDPAPPQFVLQVGQKQHDVVKTSLPHYFPNG